MGLINYYEDLDNIHVGTMESRSYYIPFSSAEAALNEVRESSERFQLLSGEWKFKYYESIQKKIKI